MTVMESVIMRTIVLIHPMGLREEPVLQEQPIQLGDPV